MKIAFYCCLLALFFSCGSNHSNSDNNQREKKTGYHLAILGIAQDAGYPQTGCRKDCCQLFREGTEPSRGATSLAIINYDTNEKWLFEATPDIKTQLYSLNKMVLGGSILPNGIFLTHAHIGHYTGLMHFGREAMGTKELPVFAMPKMKNFLENEAPWKQLVDLKNIKIQPLKGDSTMQLSEKLEVTPFRVPHRDEFSETVGYRIKANKTTILFIPDIDKWNKWEKSIIEEIKTVDLALLDGTFYQNGELRNRDMSQIPHPFVVESMELFKSLPIAEKQKVMFIHFNHTNPLIWQEDTRKVVEAHGFRVAKEGWTMPL